MQLRAASRFVACAAIAACSLAAAPSSWVDPHRQGGGAPGAAAGTCHFSYATQHSYSSADISGLGIQTADVWYVNGDGTFNHPMTLPEFLAQTEAQTHAGLLHYFTEGEGKNISSGLQTTNAIVLDIETPANLKLLGTHLTAKRATGDPTFDRLVAALRMRVRVAKQLCPRAQVGVYGSPNGPNSYKTENWTESMEGYTVAASLGATQDAPSPPPALPPTLL